MGVIDAAEEAKSPVIIFLVQVLSATPHLKIFSHDGINGAKATVPVITSLGSWWSMEIIRNAWTHGMNSLMRDASAFDFEENIGLTKEAVDFFHPLAVFR
ncbi:class II fructose-bisphosphate aldolase [Shigella flexneri]